MSNNLIKPLGVYSEVGKLHKVLVCRPGLAHTRVTPMNCHDLLFDDVFWVEQAKKDHADFVLWKPSDDDQPGWPSPWGRGRPG